MNQKKPQGFEFLKYEQETYQIIGAALEVSNNLGCGFLESVYQEALAIELRRKEVPFIEQAEIEIQYKGISLEKIFRVDFLCFETIIVEIKAIQNLSKREEAQLLNYLKAAKSEIGLILNFGSRKLTWKRMINSS